MGCGREKGGRTDTGASVAGAERLLKKAEYQTGMSQMQPFLGSGRACLKFSALQKATTLTETQTGSRLLLQGHTGSSFSSLYFCSAVNKGVERRSPYCWCLNFISFSVQKIYNTLNHWGFLTFPGNILILWLLHRLLASTWVFRPQQDLGSLDLALGRRMEPISICDDLRSKFYWFSTMFLFPFLCWWFTWWIY